MVSGLKPYPVLKESGVERLGEVPAHWGIRRLRTLSRLPIANGIGESAQAYRADWPRYVRITDIAGPRSLRASTTASLPPEVAWPALLEPGDILFAAVGATYGKSYLYDGACGPACFAGYLVRLTLNNDVIPEFLSYWSESSGFWDQVHCGVIKATIENFSASRYKRLVCPIPSINEQRAIARFLDHADRRIRRYIRAKEKLIDLLEEQKQAIVHQAVTGRFDVRNGQPYPAYKDSGVEWLGEVPAHWEVRRIKSLSVVKRGASPRPIADAKYFEDEGEYAWVRIADVTASDRYLEKTTQRLSPLGQSLSVELPPGSLFLSIAGSVGKPIITRIRCCIHDGFVYFPGFRGDVEFLCRVLSCKAPFGRLGKFGTQLNLNTDTVGGIYLGWPPQAEQRRIVQFLDKSTRAIDRLISSIRRELCLAQEYRIRLIADVVTGKLDVREAATAIPDVDPLVAEDTLSDATEPEVESHPPHP